MAANAHVHVISKTNIAEHHVFPISTSSLPALAAGHVRVRTALIAMTANNLSYAKMGGLFHWWETYPVPESLPEPYNDQQQYGIVPAWGYGEVLESKVKELQPGTLVWGFWPTTSLPVDLKLTPTEPAGHFVESSEHRQDIWNLYQRYIVRDPVARLSSVSDQQTKDMALDAIYTVGSASFLINQFVFGVPPIHPTNAGPWTSHDADLSKAVVVSLSAAGKTAAYFNDAVLHERPEGSGPLGLLAITSSPGSLGLKASKKIPLHTVSYQDATSSDTMDWLRSLDAKRAVIVDFGGRDDSLVRVNDFLETQYGGPAVTIIGVGGEPKVWSKEDMMAYVQRNASLKNRVQMNASSVKDAAMEQIGAAALFEQQYEGHENFVRRGNTDTLKVQIGNGINGDGGIKGAWMRLCSQSVPSDVGLAHKI